MTGPCLTVLDLRNPANPRLVTRWGVDFPCHDLSLSPDGKRAYVGWYAADVGHRRRGVQAQLDHRWAAAHRDVHRDRRAEVRHRRGGGLLPRRQRSHRRRHRRAQPGAGGRGASRRELPRELRGLARGHRQRAAALHVALRLGRRPERRQPGLLHLVQLRTAGVRHSRPAQPARTSPSSRRTCARPTPAVGAPGPCRR